MKIKIHPLLFVLVSLGALWVYAPSPALAETFSNCPTFSGGNYCDASNNYRFVGGSINSCTTSNDPRVTVNANPGGSKEWRCSSNSWVCPSGKIDCNGTCQIPFAQSSCPAGTQVINACGATADTACGCAAGYVKSGLTAKIGQCVTFAERFGELLQYGLSQLGGAGNNGSYDFSGANVINLKADSAATADLANTVADNAITSDKIALDTITAADIAPNAVETSEIKDGTIADVDISPTAAIARTKLANCTADNQILKYTVAGGWACAAAGITAETDPVATAKIGTLTNTKWCTSDGSKVICNTAPPVATETDPVATAKIGTVNQNGKWCTSDGSKVNCATSAPVTTETDPTLPSSCPDGYVPQWDTFVAPGSWACTAPTSFYTLPTASNTTLGGVKVGTGISISSGTISASLGTDIASIEIVDDTIANADISSSAAINLTKLSSSDAGGACANDEVLKRVSGSWQCAADATGSYTLPAATSSALGGVKVGTGLSISNDILSTTFGTAVDSSEITDNTITSADIAPDTITAAVIALGAVGSSEILDGTIASADIALDTIVAGDIAAGAVGTSEIADSSIATADLADGSVTSAKIADRTITLTDLVAELIADEVRDAIYHVEETYNIDNVTYGNEWGTLIATCHNGDRLLSGGCATFPADYGVYDSRDLRIISSYSFINSWVCDVNRPTVGQRRDVVVSVDCLDANGNDH